MADDEAGPPPPLRDDITVPRRYVHRLGPSLGYLLAVLEAERPNVLAEDGWWVAHTYAEWGERTGLQESTLRRHFSTLGDRGLIERKVARPGDSTQVSLHLRRVHPESKLLPPGWG